MVRLPPVPWGGALVFADCVVLCRYWYHPKDDKLGLGPEPEPEPGEPEPEPA